MPKKKELSVQGNPIRLLQQDKGDYINLTDMVCNREATPEITFATG